MSYFDTIKRLSKAVVVREKRRAMLAAVGAYERTFETTCPCCGHHGKFTSFGFANRPGALCPSCECLERHRLLQLALNAGFFAPAGKRVLHFADEVAVTKMIDPPSLAQYDTADIEPGRAALVINIEDIALEDNSYDLIICSHVLEHVDDTKAMPELYRVLAPGGVLIAMVPIIEGWERSYEDASVTSPEAREKHFAQNDHVRYYGADFRDRLKAAGFQLDEFTASGRDSIKYGLMRGEKVFRGRKL